MKNIFKCVVLLLSISLFASCGGSDTASTKKNQPAAKTTNKSTKKVTPKKTAKVHPWLKGYKRQAKLATASLVRVNTDMAKNDVVTASRPKDGKLRVFGYTYNSIDNKPAGEVIAIVNGKYRKVQANSFDTPYLGKHTKNSKLNKCGFQFNLDYNEFKNDRQIEVRILALDNKSKKYQETNPKKPLIIKLK